MLLFILYWIGLLLFVDGISLLFFVFECLGSLLLWGVLLLDEFMDSVIDLLSLLIKENEFFFDFDIKWMSVFVILLFVGVVFVWFFFLW